MRRIDEIGARLARDAADVRRLHDTAVELLSTIDALGLRFGANFDEGANFNNAVKGLRAALAALAKVGT